jgi:ubiquitin carboxyl-terminal hydrolase 4/11/15
MVVDSRKGKKPAVSLSKCFEAFEEEETLTGNDQFYCRKCKEHRDITKKLQVYKLPQIMML